MGRPPIFASVEETWGSPCQRGEPIGGGKARRAMPWPANYIISTRKISIGTVNSNKQRLM